ncbi:hypothetical protein AQUCO_01600252v1 [Aquilegia coerulea]|uniref:Uncharacterized protein n=1 Tax=Aquilegia coerulea TaxID=218851 RepID=A0A2G5DQR9_AQUCA|nr:hypothetical protein AQUCO_01600252v1 [Aquilegia coerulea]
MDICTCWGVPAFVYGNDTDRYFRDFNITIDNNTIIIKHHFNLRQLFREYKLKHLIDSRFSPLLRTITVVAEQLSELMCNILSIIRAIIQYKC